MYEAWFPRGLDEPDIALLKVVISSAELWDAPSSAVAHAVSFVKSKLAGEIAAPGTHKTVTMMGGKSTEQKESGLRASEAKTTM